MFKFNKNPQKKITIFPKAFPLKNPRKKDKTSEKKTVLKIA
jgi:hypothetical protein